MNRPANYNTRQREAIVAYVASLGDTHVTAAQIVEHFNNTAIPISRTTIYRHLEKLVESGVIHRYTVDEVSGACFQYAGGEAQHFSEHFHLKCECCGRLLHLQCSTLHDAKSHIFNSHEFEVNAAKTVLYGKCRGCLHGV